MKLSWFLLTLWLCTECKCFLFFFYFFFNVCSYLQHLSGAKSASGLLHGAQTTAALPEPSGSGAGVPDQEQSSGSVQTSPPPPPSLLLHLESVWSYLKIFLFGNPCACDDLSMHDLDKAGTKHVFLGTEDRIAAGVGGGFRRPRWKPGICFSIRRKFFFFRKWNVQGSKPPCKLVEFCFWTVFVL